MSYASIASHNIPEGEMPKPDQDLLDGHFEGEHAASTEVDHKVNILPAGTDPEHPPVHQDPISHQEPIVLHHNDLSEAHNSLNVAPEPMQAPPKGSVQLPEAKEVKDTAKKAGKEAEHTANKVGKEAEQTAKKVGKEAEKTANKAGKEIKNTANEIENTANKVGKEAEKKAKELEKKGKQYADKAKKELHEAESQLAPYWEKTKDIVLRPGTLGGLMGIANVGLLSTIGYFAYTRKDQPWDRRIVGATLAGTLALFGAEGYVAESYLETPEGKQEAERAKREGSKFYLQAKERVLRPQVAGGLVGAFNVAVLSTVGYFSYKHWNQPWDRNVVSAVTVGLLGLSGLEGWAGKEYVDKQNL